METVKKKINSRRKGANAELELSKLFQEWGFVARRRQQYSGTEGSDDVYVEELDKDFFIESKAVESINMHTVMKKALEQCGGKTPVLFHKRNRKGWLTCMRSEDWLDFLKIVLKAREILDAKVN